MKTIKLIFTVFAILLGCIQIQAQQDNPLPYKARALFKADTLQYLEYNFTKRSLQYKGKKVSDVLKDIDFPILRIAESCWIDSITSDGKRITKLKFLALSVRQIEDKPNVLKDYYVRVHFADMLTLAEYKKASGFSRDNPEPELTPQLYDLIKDLKVSSVGANPYIIMEREYNLKKKQMQEQKE